jgi:hypothetical protein
VVAAKSKSLAAFNRAAPSSFELDRGLRRRVMFHHDGQHYTSVQYPDERFLCVNWRLPLSFGTLREAQNEKPVCVRDYFIAGIGFVSGFAACAIPSGHGNCSWHARH